MVGSRVSTEWEGSLMNTIWKYSVVTAKTRQCFEMPVGAKVLHVAEQNGLICLWAQVDPYETNLDSRYFHVVGTGNKIPDKAGEFVGTALVGEFVFHLFEEKQ